MKIILLLAGKGRRLENLTRNRHKAFISLNGTPCLNHLLDRLLSAGATELIPVLGFDSEAVYALIGERCNSRIKITPVFNLKYEVTNNLGSLICAREYVEGDPFVVCNGDLVINKNIIKNLIESDNESAIAVDDSKKDPSIDSPGIKVIDGRVYDLGRHISFKRSGGYAVGVYKFGRRLSSIFFPKAEQVFAKNPNAGFHDPLIPLFKDYPVYVCSTKGRSWMDIDKKEDISIACNLLQNIKNEEEHEIV
jgi:choline kinase